jgi:hypothetical protein
VGVVTRGEGVQPVRKNSIIVKLAPATGAAPKGAELLKSTHMVHRMPKLVDRGAVGHDARLVFPACRQQRSNLS